MHFIIDPHPYPTQIIVSIDQTDQQLRRLLNRALYNPNSDTDQCFNFDANEICRTVYIGDSTQIVMRYVRWFLADDGVIAHELFHSLVYVMDSVGATLDVHNHEPWAYQLHYLTNEFYKRIKKKH